MSAPERQTATCDLCGHVVEQDNLAEHMLDVHEVDLERGVRGPLLVEPEEDRDA
jgi:hypothetical protein